MRYLYAVYPATLVPEPNPTPTVIVAFFELVNVGGTPEKLTPNGIAAPMSWPLGPFPIAGLPGSSTKSAVGSVTLAVFFRSGFPRILPAPGYTDVPGMIESVIVNVPDGGFCTTTGAPPLIGTSKRTSPTAMPPLPWKTPAKPGSSKLKTPVRTWTNVSLIEVM